jgi:hypothetical protein
MSIKIEYFKNLSSDKLKDLHERLCKGFSDEKIIRELPPDMANYIMTENIPNNKPFFVDEPISDSNTVQKIGNVTTRISRCINLINKEVLTRFYSGKL